MERSTLQRFKPRTWGQSFISFLMLVAQLAASTGLVALSSVFSKKTSEHVLTDAYGEAMFNSSFYLRDLSLCCGFLAFVCSTCFAGQMLAAYEVTNMIVLCAILCGGYYITFRGLLLTLFSYRFCNILRKQYGHSETVRFDGAIARYHAGGVPSYIGSHFHQQMSTSSRVGFPIGVVWALFILACLSYLPAFWIQGLIFSGGIALTCSIASIVALLPPSSDEDVKISSWKGSPYSCMVPPVMFLSVFTILTPSSCQLVNSSVSLLMGL